MVNDERSLFHSPFIIHHSPFTIPPMLTQLLHLLEQNHGRLHLADLSRQLGAEPGAVLGMIETLVRKGRLVEAPPACGVCETCPLHSGCNLPVRRARQFVIAHNRQSPVQS